MNRWLVLFATMLVTIGFATTITTTLSNPNFSNILISTFMIIMILIGLVVFSKSEKKKE